MTALDTNVMVRYLVQDDPAQGRKAAEFIEAAELAGEPILIGNIVLCEVVWILDSAYGYGRNEITTAIDQILQTGVFRFERKDIVRAALNEYRDSRKLDLADCLIGRVHEALGSTTTVTFDRSLRGLDAFRML